MQGDVLLRALSDAAGLHPSFIDMTGTERFITPETQRALLAANGLPAATDAEVRASLALLQEEQAQAFVPPDVIVGAGEAQHLPVEAGAEWRVLDEQTGAELAAGSSDGMIVLPRLEVGIYLLHVEKGRRRQTATLLVTPARAPSVREVTGAERQWGLVAALYGLHSQGNGGIGDYADLAELAGLMGQAGAAFTGINPVHALGWANETTVSPYSPTHRGFLNAMHIRLEGSGATGTARGEGDFLDYASHAGWHRPGLQAGFAAFEAEADGNATQSFAAFEKAGGTALCQFAAFEALSTRHGADARAWPSDLQDPAKAAMAADPDEMRFHLWMQWVAERQLAAAQERARSNGAGLGLYLDLAVGSRLGGAEHWANAEARADGVSIGAPPDALSPAGQNWGLCAYAPRKLQATRYAALRQILRQNMRHCGLLRIDHALGLNRSFWLPLDGTPGGYISQPFDALLAVVCIEAARNRTVIVGEDLGLVPEGFRARIAEAGLYGYTVLQFERDNEGRFRMPGQLRPQTLACFGTHDTPTLRGFWEGRDIDWWRRLDWIAEAEEPQARARRTAEKRDLLDAQDDNTVETTPFEDVRRRMHQRLAEAPTALAAVQLDDVLGIGQAQNLPGTVEEHPNWRRAYPLDLADLARDPTLQQTASMMREAGRGRPHPDDERIDHDR